MVSYGVRGPIHVRQIGSNSGIAHVVFAVLVTTLMVVSSIGMIHQQENETTPVSDGLDFDARQHVAPAPPEQKGDPALGGTSECHFIKNLGQWDDPEALYTLNVADYQVTFTHDAMIVTLRNYLSPPSQVEIGTLAVGNLPSLPLANAAQGTQVNTLDVRMTFSMALNTVPVGRNELDWRMNYFLGDDGTSWQSDVPVYDEIVIVGLYRGIDAVFKVDGDRMKTEFIVHPGADPQDITVHVLGHEGMQVTGSGALSISTPLGELLDDGLVVYYADDENARIGSSFQLLDDDSYGFEVNAYDVDRTIVIDPLLYSTFLGSREYDQCNGIAIDDQGAVYITGYSLYTFPKTDGAVKPKNYLHHNIFVTKLNADGTDLVYGAIIGGSNDDIGNGIAVDASGAAYITGYTFSDDFPTTTGAYQTSHPTSVDPFVLKLHPIGNGLIYSTCLGTPEQTHLWDEYGIAIDADDSGNAYVLGVTGSPNFTTTSGVFQPDLAGKEDAFLVKIDRDGRSLHYSTFLGGSNWDTLHDIHVDSKGAVFVVGASGGDFPTTPGSYQRSLEGSDTVSAVIAKVNPTASALVYSSFLGGNDLEVAYALEVDGVGCAYVTGYTESTDFPTTPGAHQRVMKGDVAAFVTKMSADGSDIEFSTLLEDGGTYFGRGIAVDTDGYVYVAGRSRFDASTGYDEVIGAIGDRCVFVAQFDPTGSGMLYFGAIAGSYNPIIEIGDNLVIDMEGNVHVCGRATSNGLPTTEGAFQEESAGDYDAFVFKLSIDSFPPIADLGVDRTVRQGDEVILDTTLCSDNVGITNFTWIYVYDGNKIMAYGPEHTVIFDIPGTYAITLNLTDAMGNLASDEVNVTVLDTQPPTADPGDDITINQRWPAPLDGSASTDNHEIANWTWRFEYNGSEIVIFGEMALYKIELAGVYFVTLTVRDISGNEDSNTIRIVVVDIDPPTAEAGPDQEVVKGTVFQFDGTGSQDNVGIAEWTWTFKHAREDQELDGPEPSFEFTEPGVYKVTLKVMDSEGSYSTDTVQVVVNPKDDDKKDDKDGPAITSAAAILALCLVGAAIVVMRRKA